MTEVLVIVGAYLLGAVPFGYCMAKWFCGVDILEHGSRSIGFTNTYRICGAAVGIPVLILDVLKGTVSVLAAYGSGADSTWLPVLAGVAAMVGHSFSVYIGFRGGKAVAAGAGVFLALQWEALMIALIAFAIVLKLTRFMSLASMTLAVILACTLTAEWFLLPAWAPSAPVLLVGWVTAILVVLRHRTNIQRLLAGTENRFGAKNETADTHNG